MEEGEGAPEEADQMEAGLGMAEGGQAAWQLVALPMHWVAEVAVHSEMVAGVQPGGAHQSSAAPHGHARQGLGPARGCWKEKPLSGLSQNSKAFWHYPV